jgi:hypothetical protein
LLTDSPINAQPCVARILVDEAPDIQFESLIPMSKHGEKMIISPRLELSWLSGCHFYIKKISNSIETRIQDFFVCADVVGSIF